jgi:hypothetical protein
VLYSIKVYKQIDSKEIMCQEREEKRGESVKGHVWVAILGSSLLSATCIWFAEIWFMR